MRIDALSQIKPYLSYSNSLYPNVWEQPLGVKAGPGFEHSDDSVKQLTHNGHQRADGLLSFFEQPLIESFDDGAVSGNRVGPYLVSGLRPISASVARLLGKASV